MLLPYSVVELHFVFNIFNKTQKSVLVSYPWVGGDAATGKQVAAYEDKAQISRWEQGMLKLIYPSASVKTEAGPLNLFHPHKQRV